MIAQAEVITVHIRTSCKRYGYESNKRFGFRCLRAQQLWISIVALLLISLAAHGQKRSLNHNITGSGAPGTTHLQNPAALLDFAGSLIKKQKWAEAEVAVRQYLQQQPASLKGHTLLGLILYREGKPQASMQEYIAAANLGDLTSSDLKIYAFDCAMLQDVADADKWLSKSLEIARSDWEGWDALGHIRFEEQRYDAAISAFHECLKIKPRTISSESGIGMAYEAMGRSDDAAAAYRTAIRWQDGTQRRDYVPFLGLGRTLLGQNKPDEALPFALRATQLSPRDISSLRLLGKTYSALNRLVPAKTALEEAVRLDPQNADVHFMLGQVYRRLGLKQQAEIEFARYSSLNEKK